MSVLLLNKTSGYKYPIVMFNRHTGIVALFKTEDHGIIIHASSFSQVGTILPSFDCATDDVWIPFSGSITWEEGK